MCTASSPGQSCSFIHLAGQHLKYAHSTLRGHALAGEERFAVEWHKEDDSVWYENALPSAANCVACMISVDNRHEQWHDLQV